MHGESEDDWSGILVFDATASLHHSQTCAGGHLFTMATSPQQPLLHNGHPSATATSILIATNLWLPLCNSLLPVMATSPQWPHLWKVHLSSFYSGNGLQLPK